ncbi:hypothetical protein GW17_00002595 [Ensete ventricosum]|nr:hypothetical protein GW17_00002595 [Ensete ventricosum]
MGRQKVMINGLPKCFALVLFTYLFSREQDTTRLPTEDIRCASCCIDQDLPESKLYKAPHHHLAWLRRGKKKRRGRRKKERRSKKREEKKENRENLDSKPFLDPDPMPPSLDDPHGMTLRIARYTRYARTIPYRAKLGKLVWYKISNPCY